MPHLFSLPTWLSLINLACWKHSLFCLSSLFRFALLAGRFFLLLLFDLFGQLFGQLCYLDNCFEWFFTSLSSRLTPLVESFFLWVLLGLSWKISSQRCFLDGSLLSVLFDQFCSLDGSLFDSFWSDPLARGSFLLIFFGFFGQLSFLNGFLV